MHKKRLKEEELKVVKEFPNLLSFFYGEIKFPLEWVTGFEPVASDLEGRHSTNWVTPTWKPPAWFEHAPARGFARLVKKIAEPFLFRQYTHGNFKKHFWFIRDLPLTVSPMLTQINLSAALPFELRGQNDIAFSFLLRGELSRTVRRLPRHVLNIP